MSEKKTVSLEEMIDKDGTPDQPTKDKKGDGILEKIWNADSGSKSDEAYRDHALNWDGKDSTGKIVKGLEGLIGNMDRAVIDLVVGVMQKLGELFTKKEPEQRV